MAAIPHWEAQQLKTFTNWVNVYLGKRELLVEDLTTAFDDGIKLINLIELISNESLGKYNPRPKMKIHQVDNLNVALRYINNFVREKGIRVLYSAEDILDHNRKLILGMIWVMIHKFQIANIGDESMSGVEGLLLWCRRKTAGYAGVAVDNFTTSWQDGLAFCALIHKHRPDLLDFASLDPADRLENLRRAFAVADEALGIPRLLDPEDLAQDSSPDEKSVVTYVSFYWKAFSQMERTQTGASRLATVLARARANRDAATDYTDRATALQEWVRARTAEFSNPDFGQSVEDVVRAIVALNEYRLGPKPTRVAEKLALRNALVALATKLGNQRAPRFQPPAGLTPDETDALWEELQAAERALEEAAQRLLRERRARAGTHARLRGRHSKLLSWVEDRRASLLAASVGATRAETESEQRAHELFCEEMNAYNQKLASLRDEVAAIHATAAGDSDSQPSSAADSDSASEIGALLDALGTEWSGLESLAATRTSALEEALTAHQATEARCLEFSKAAELLNAVLEDLDEVTHEPITVYSLADAERLLAVSLAVEPRVAEAAERLEALEALATGIDRRPILFSRFDMDALANRLLAISGTLDSRRAEIELHVADQRAADALRQEFAQLAAEFNSFVTESAHSLGADLPGGENAEQNVAALTTLFAEVTHAADERRAQLVAVHEKLVAAGVADNEYTTHSLADLLAASDELLNGGRRRISSLEEAIVAAKGFELTADQLREIAEAFQYFDRNQSGLLTRTEFLECLRSLGEDTEGDHEAELLEKFAALDLDHDDALSLEEFSQFMVSRVRITDSQEDLLAVLRSLAGGRDVVTVGELRAALPADVAEFAVSVGQPNEAGEINVATLIGSLFESA